MHWYSLQMLFKASAINLFRELQLKIFTIECTKISFFTYVQTEQDFKMILLLMNISYLILSTASVLWFTRKKSGESKIKAIKQKWKIMFSKFKRCNSFCRRMSNLKNQWYQFSHRKQYRWLHKWTIKNIPLEKIKLNIF